MPENKTKTTEDVESPALVRFVDRLMAAIRTYEAEVQQQAKGLASGRPGGLATPDRQRRRHSLTTLLEARDHLVTGLS
jgi:hypothetical protein